MSNPTQDLQALLNAVRYDRDIVPDKDVEILTIGGKMVGTKGSFVALTGKPKAGKSIFLGAMTASAATPSDVWGIKTVLPEDSPRMLYFDTEQGDYDFWVSMKRIAGHAGMENLPRSIDAFHLREYDTRLKLPLINQAVMSEENVGMIVIDGLLDLCVDFNSIEESRRIIDWIRFITQKRKVMVLAVIHQSKREDFSLGHLGSEVDRFAQSVMQVENDQAGKFFTLSPVRLRHGPFEPITVMFDGTAFNCVTIDIKSKQAKPESQRPPIEFDDTQHFYYMNAVLSSEGNKYSDIIDALKERKGMSIINAKKFCTYWQDKEWIVKKSDGLYYRRQDSRIISLTQNK